MTRRPHGWVRPSRAGRYFQWSEFEASGVAEKYGLPNTIGPDAAWAITRWCAMVGDRLRRHIGRPIRITSGFRSAQVNERVGGSPTSQHTTGEAADIKVRGLDAFGAFDTLLNVTSDYDQVIVYHPQRGGHLHVSVRVAKAPRRQVLYAPAPAAATPRGVVTTVSGDYWRLDDAFTDERAREQFETHFDADGDPIEEAGNRG